MCDEIEKYHYPDIIKEIQKYNRLTQQLQVFSWNDNVLDDLKQIHYDWHEHKKEPQPSGGWGTVLYFFLFGYIPKRSGYIDLCEEECCRYCIEYMKSWLNKTTDMHEVYKKKTVEILDCLEKTNYNTDLYKINIQIEKLCKLYEKDTKITIINSIAELKEKLRTTASEAYEEWLHPEISSILMVIYIKNTRLIDIYASGTKEERDFESLRRNLLKLIFLKRLEKNNCFGISKDTLFEFKEYTKNKSRKIFLGIFDPEYNTEGFREQVSNRHPKYDLKYFRNYFDNQSLRDVSRKHNKISGYDKIVSVNRLRLIQLGYLLVAPKPCAKLAELCCAGKIISSIEEVINNCPYMLDGQKCSEENYEKKDFSEGKCWLCTDFCKWWLGPKLSYDEFLYAFYADISKSNYAKIYTKEWKHKGDITIHKFLADVKSNTGVNFFDCQEDGVAKDLNGGLVLFKRADKLVYCGDTIDLKSKLNCLPLKELEQILKRAKANRDRIDDTKGLNYIDAKYIRLFLEDEKNKQEIFKRTADKLLQVLDSRNSETAETNR